MTTFTLQDLCNALPTTPEEDELFKQMENIGLKEAKDGMVEILHTRHVTEPQPTQMGEPLPNPDLPTIINTICAQLQLLATVIKQQPSTTPPEGDPPSLQETVELVLKQSDWFEKMVQAQVEERVEYEVDSYFEHRFDPTDHFDFGDAISNEVHDRIDDAVRDQLDDKLEEVVAEKLESASVSISF
jgi:hypothetical protein